ncbi:DUF1654 domain-containing protein [Pseudomonas aeruginosa]|uniref:DUF1654 domain-containing protein n=1 Tax=Pseudomonas aeruginosa TaxID=287 RepID=UPI001A2C3240|nr:DUF1654 domain-containing protein [Pseudomonas aeruginosa]MBH3499147.1 DUF1654 domain-containing protein [Pseudomonas aeruginosa]MBV5888761.1 DUF1654 domain-containing protein [Pseudomonas aeruginosa]MDA3430828.1 DUF1654 domain-containing protein [Pseudomonas aeruginosa]MDU0508412.1 DUF1654 domain-containing protein [Pseudomonas aeruginosa]HEJ5564188.1 DUF1654 domain-containing protein [Pseudomonas aeruginosa]
MAKQKRPAEQKSSGMNAVERIRLRVSEMLNTPKARSLRQATIWRLDSDSDQAWEQVMGELAEADELEMEQNEDGTVTLKWDAPTDDDLSFDEMEPEPDLVIQRLHEEAPL